MRRLAFLYCFWPALLAAQTFQLAPPQLVCDSPFFARQTRITLAFDLEGAEIRYTLDGTAPDARALRYDTPLDISQTTLLKAAAFHPDFKPSETVDLQVFRTAGAPVNISLDKPPSSIYPGGGAATLVNGRKGSADLHDRQWLGFAGDTAVVQMTFTQKKRFKTLTVSTLQQPGAWVFPPRRIEVWGAAKPDARFESLGAWNLPGPLQADSPAQSSCFIKIPLRGDKVRFLKISVQPYGPLPDWHPGKGLPAWLFLDEIMVE